MTCKICIMQCVKILKLLIFTVLLFVLHPASYACDIDSTIEELMTSESNEQREDALYGMSSSLLFCGPSAYARAIKASFKYSEFGSFFLKTFLFQYKQYFPNSFSIGSKWNRREFDELDKRDLSKYIFRIGTASGVYLGRYQGKSLFATNRHVIESEECSNIIISNIDVTNYSCHEILNPESHLDYAFILSDKQIELSPIDINKEMKTQGEALITGGRGYFLNEAQVFKEESSELCQIFHDDELGQSMGCDSSPGDSGSPVFLKDKNELYGLANSTANTTLEFSNDEILAMVNDEKFRELIKLQSSHFVPFYMILNDVEGRDEEVKNIIECISSKGCLK